MEKDKKIKYLHIISAGKFHKDFINFINKNFDINDHFFILSGEDINNFRAREKRNIKVISRSVKDKFFLIKKMNNCEKIILHGFFSNVLILFFQPWLHRKCHWIIWGFQRDEDLKFKEKIQLFFKKIILSRVPRISSFIEEEYELAKRLYGIRGKYYSFMYPSTIYKDIGLFKIEKDNNKIFIQIGNSSIPSNNHLDIFRLLEKYKEDNIEIICPLSYGDFNYRKIVIERGNEVFGRKFNPLIDFMPLEEYLKILGRIDIAIFNFDRQQGISNINSLLAFGKKVYMRRDTVMWDFYFEKGIKIYDIDDFNLDLIDPETAERNKNKIKEYFSEENLIKQWSEIFNS